MQAIWISLPSQYHFGGGNHAPTSSTGLEGLGNRWETVGVLALRWRIKLEGGVNGRPVAGEPDEGWVSTICFHALILSERVGHWLSTRTSTERNYIFLPCNHLHLRF